MLTFGGARFCQKIAWLTCPAHKHNISKPQCRPCFLYMTWWHREFLCQEKKVRETEMLKFYNSNMYIHIEYQCRYHPSPGSQNAQSFAALARRALRNRITNPCNHCNACNHHITLHYKRNSWKQTKGLSAQPQEELFTTFCIKASYTKKKCIPSISVTLNLHVTMCFHVYS